MKEEKCESKVGRGKGAAQVREWRQKNPPREIFGVRISKIREQCKFTGCRHLSRSKRYRQSPISQGS